MSTAHTNRLHVTLTPEERRTLEAWQRASTLPQGLVRRGRVVLLLADGVPIARIARMVGLAPRHVYKWARRFLAHGVAGLEGLPQGRHAAEKEET